MSRSSHLSFRFLAAFFLSIALLWPSGDSFARGGGGGGHSSGGFSGGRSSFSSSGSSWGSSSRSSSGSSWGGGSSSSSWGSRSSSSGAAANPSTGSGWGATSSSRSSGPSSAADRALASKVNRSGNTTSRGTLVTTRQQAIPQGAPTQWATAPATHPSYVPYGAMMPDGRYASVYWDPTYRNYGFWDSLGHWVMWNAILNSGPRNYYYYDSGPGYGNSGYGTSAYYGNSGVYVHSRGSSILPTLIGLMLIFTLIAVGMYFYYKHAAEVAEQYQTQTAAYGYAPAPAPPSSMSVQRPPMKRSANLQPWLTFPPGSFITLSDNQSKEDSQKRGQGFNGIRYAVESSAVADDSEGFATWALITLNDQYQKLLLVVKSVDEAIDHRVYYANEQFHPARREDVIKRRDLWLFEPPANETDFDPAELQYTAEVVQKTDSAELVYVRKDQGERHADYVETPTQSGARDLVATIVEYSTSDATDNPELLILEIGSASRRTGEVNLYLGCPIDPAEIDVIKA